MGKLKFMNPREDRKEGKLERTDNKITKINKYNKKLMFRYISNYTKWKKNYICQLRDIVRLEKKKQSSFQSCFLLKLNLKRKNI